MTRQVLRTSIVNEGTDQLLSRVKQALPQLKLDEKAPEIKEFTNMEIKILDSLHV